MKKICSVLLLFVLSFFLCQGLSAQRQTPGRMSLSGYTTWSALVDKPIGFSGGGATWNRYFYNSFVSAGVEVSANPFTKVNVTDPIYDSQGQEVAPGESETIRALAYDYTLGGGYYVRLLAPRSRVAILSAGINGYTGIRYSPALGKFNPDDLDADEIGSKEKKKKVEGPVGFILNIVPEVLLEVFPMKNASFYLSFRPKLSVVSTLDVESDWARMYLGAGVKYYL